MAKNKTLIELTYTDGVKVYTLDMSEKNFSLEALEAFKETLEKSDYDSVVLQYLSGKTLFINKRYLVKTRLFTNNISKDKNKGSEE